MFRLLVLAQGIALLAACGRAPSGGVARAPGAASGSSLEWQGRRACADCEGIVTRLVLQHDGGRQDYQLIETYRAAGRDARFAEHGHWQRSAALLRLQGDSGSRRLYALLPDGRLQPRDGHGEPLAMDEDMLLVPVAAIGRGDDRDASM